MTTIIKATDHNAAIQHAAFNFDDMAGQANAYLANVRHEALGIVAKAHGLNADLLPLSVDNTDIYRLMYATLFGVWLP